MAATHRSSLKDPKDRLRSSATAPVDPNALRLRENQRRSRLRKKEYLASLESRYRDCQRLGIEASVEVQTAAKRVVRENISLRELLRSKGVTDSEVDGWVRRASSGSDTDASPVDAAIRALVRRPCGGDIDTNASGRRKSTGMVNERNVLLSLQTRGISEEAFQQQETSPTSSRSSRTPSYSPLSPTLPMTPPHPTPRRPSMTASFSTQSPGYTPCMRQQPQQQQDLHSFYHLASPPLHSPPTTAPQFSDRFMMQQHNQQQFVPSQPHGSMPCEMATSMIAQMASEGNAVDVLTRELCPHGTLQGCVVNTGVLFGMMDRTCV